MGLLLGLSAESGFVLADNIPGGLVATNSLWAMKKGTAEASAPTNAWRNLGFDDATWTSAQAPFYFDTKSPATYSGNTPLSDMRNGYLCIYLRRPFVVANSAEFGALLLRAFCDDGFVGILYGVVGVLWESWRVL